MSPPFSMRFMISSRAIVKVARISARAAAKSREPGEFAKVRIIGAIVWKLRPPRICGAARAPSPLRKVRMVIAKIVGFSTGSTTRRRTVQVEAPIWVADSTVC